MNKEELKEYINDKISTLSLTKKFQLKESDRRYWEGKEDATRELFNLIDQLDEPEKPVSKRDKDPGVTERTPVDILRMNMGETHTIAKDEKTRSFHAVTKELFETYKAKNHDYGDSFSETFEKLGLISAVTRISDKTNRLQSLAQNEQRVENESLEDTLLDLAGYAIMTVMELREEQD